MMSERQFNIEDEMEEIQYLSPWILVMLADAIIWSRDRGLRVVVTSMLREANDGISVSETHQTGRAIDLAVRSWPKKEIEALAKYLNDKYASKLGTSPVGKPPVACLYHNNGNGWHFHLQVRRYIDAKRDIAIS